MPQSGPRATSRDSRSRPQSDTRCRRAVDEVLLANGDPLYGKGMPASYLPLQRLTQVRIDQGGNLWAINNWKPDFTWDATGEVLVGDKAKGGGGNSLVIFVGVAAPRPIEGWDPACSARRTGYAQLTPTLAKNPTQLNQPIGQARAEITAAALGLDRSLVLTPQQTQEFLGRPGTPHRPAAADLGLREQSHEHDRESDRQGRPRHADECHPRQLRADHLL